MNIELQEILINKYPKIFKDVTNNTICGIDCGDGWYWL